MAFLFCERTYFIPTEFYLFDEVFNESIHLFRALPTLVYVLGESVNEAKSL